MKRYIPILIALLILPAVTGHGDEDGFLKAGEYIDHGKEAGARLDPGEWQNYTLAFGGGPMWEGWFYVIYGESSAPTIWTLVNHNETNHGATAGNWVWNGTGREIGRFASEGVYELQIHNTGSEVATVRWSYDQTCDCTFKPMPFSGSYAWFNPYLEAGESLRFVPGAIVVNQTDPTKTDAPLAFTATHATWSGFGSSWDTFNIHGTFDATENMTINARETGVQYVLLHMETANDARGLLLYSFEKEEREAPAGLPLLALVALAFMARRR